MKKLLFVFILICFISCNNVSIKKQGEDLYFYTGSNQTGSYVLDTLTFDKIERHNHEDSLIASRKFEFKGNMYLIKMFTSDLHAPTDGGRLFYELNELGVIYSRSTTWYSYKRLKSNNDSINSLIGVAIENILLYPELSCYQRDLIFTETVKFVPPTVE